METKMIIESWNTTVKRTTEVIHKLSNEELMREVAPNRNRGIYLLGHLIAANDSMLPLLGFRDSMFQELTERFLKNADNTKEQLFSINELKEKWIFVNDELKKHFNTLNSEDWLLKHTAISAEDFAKEPHRNKLNVLLSRTNHLSYHQGQLALLLRKTE